MFDGQSTPQGPLMPEAPGQAGLPGSVTLPAGWDRRVRAAGASLRTLRDGCHRACAGCSEKHAL